MLESIGVALFMMVIVFVVLLGIYVCMKLFLAIASKVESMMSKKNEV